MDKPISLSRRAFILGSGALSALAIAGCSQGTPSGNEDGSEAASGSAASDDKLRVGMEVALAPYNWQTDEENEFTIPVDNVPGAFADGYDIQISKMVGEAIGREPVAVKLEWDGLIDAVMKGSIDMIIAGMTATPERAESIDFSEPYIVETYGLLVQQDSEFANATTLAEFAGASVVGQKDTILDEVIDDIPDVNHLTPVENLPAAISAVLNGTADACVFIENNREGFLRANPTLKAIDFAEGDGFQEESPCNIGIAKGQEELLSKINEVLAGLSEEDRVALWEGACERQPV